MSKETNSASNAVHIVYKPFQAGLPNLRRYFSEMWNRREFAIELSRSELRAQHAASKLGQLWLVLNPLLLAGIYYTLVVIISGGSKKGPDFLAHLLAGIFVYYFISGSMISGSQSVVGLGRLITNRAFPRLLLPLSAVLVAFRRFLPTFIVYAIFHVAAGLPLGVNQLLAIPAFLLIFLFSFGLASLFATIQVYFRDAKSFLPYISRIWMYISPVLYFPEDIPEALNFLIPFNPLFGMLGIWSDALVRNELPPDSYWISAVIWATISLVAGIYFFLSREREFSVRI